MDSPCKQEEIRLVFDSLCELLNHEGHGSKDITLCPHPSLVDHVLYLLHRRALVITSEIE